MNPSIATITFTYYYLLVLHIFLVLGSGTLAYNSAVSLPTRPTTIPADTRIHHDDNDEYVYATTNDLGTDVQPSLQMKSVFGRVFRHSRNRLQTLEKETTTTKKQKEDPEELWRVLFHNSEYMPERVARVLTKVFPITRLTAFDICVRARSEGTVVVVVTNKKQAEKYCGALLKRGLMATIEPHETS